MKTKVIATNVDKKAKEDSRVIVLEKRIRDLEDNTIPVWAKTMETVAMFLFVLSVISAVWAAGHEMDRLRNAISSNCTMNPQLDCTYFAK